MNTYTTKQYKTNVIYNAYHGKIQQHCNSLTHISITDYSIMLIRSCELYIHTSSNGHI